ncbi:MAG: hypothetical protein M1818_006814 [Claussenomyces sp. TS43310]|nr:MAG: hypothetical protein M1818_006814 [Claussenomyces sp. TS43310]
MEVTGDAIAEAVLRQFAKLPAKRKPQSRGDGIQEWVPLSGVVVQDGQDLRCVALGTGMKCLPQCKVHQARGNVLHDWHAEIVTIRALNWFLLEEVKTLVGSDKAASTHLRRRKKFEITSEHFQPFTVKENIMFHMYCSEAPCGDASMELTMAAQDDATPWVLPSQSSGDAALEGSLNGRGYFSQLGIVRRKPSRPDAPTTLSKSCSDKLTLHQCTSLLSSVVSLLVSPERSYIHTLTLPESQHSPVGCTRAFGAQGRLVSLRESQWSGGYSFVPFRVRCTSVEFEFSRRSARGDARKLVPSNLAAVWTPYGDESLIGGVLQGRRQSDPQGASVLCKRSMWRLARDVAAAVDCDEITLALAAESYTKLKRSRLLETRGNIKEQVRSTLQGWARNQGEEFVFI